MRIVVHVSADDLSRLAQLDGSDSIRSVCSRVVSSALRRWRLALVASATSRPDPVSDLGGLDVPVVDADQPADGVPVALDVDDALGRLAVVLARGADRAGPMLSALLRREAASAACR